MAAGLVVAYSRATSLIWAAGTPVIGSAHSGVYFRTWATSLSKP